MDEGQPHSREKYTRRDALKALIATSSLICGARLVEGGVSLKPEEEMNAVTEVEQEARLKVAGLGEWVEFFQTQRKLSDVFGRIVLFPEITQELIGVANGIKKEAPVLSEGWKNEAKDQAEILTAASQKVSEISIEADTKDEQNLARQILANLGKVFPVLAIIGQKRLKIDSTNNNGRYTSVSQDFMEVDSNLLMNPEETVYTFIHEIGHKLDPGSLGLDMLCQMKRWVPKKEVVRYLETYAEAVYEVADHWSSLPFEDAVRMKYGLLIQIPELFDERKSVEEKDRIRAVYKQKTEEMESLLAMDDRELNRRQSAGAVLFRGVPSGASQLLTPEESLLVKYNVLTHEYMSRLYSSDKRPEAGWVISGNPVLGEARERVINEIAHFLVGPIFAGGQPIFHADGGNVWGREMNVLMLEAAKLEEARTRMYTADSKIPTLDDFRQLVFGGLTVSGQNEVEKKPFVPDNGPWPVGELLKSEGVVEVASFEGRQELPNGVTEVDQYRVYELPGNPGKQNELFYLACARRLYSDWEGIPPPGGIILTLPKRAGKWNFALEDEGEEKKVKEGEITLAISDDGQQMVVGGEGSITAELLPLKPVKERKVINYAAGGIKRIVPGASYLEKDGEGNLKMVKRRSLILADGVAIPVDYSQELEDRVLGTRSLAYMDLAGAKMILMDGGNYVEPAEDLNNFWRVDATSQPEKADATGSKMRMGMGSGDRHLLFDLETDTALEELNLVDWGESGGVYVNLERVAGIGGREYILRADYVDNRDKSEIVLEVPVDIIGIQDWPEGRGPLGGGGRG